ncbi:MAG: hypothetical protein KJ718_02420 [Nanoarchaeota archaeon]|nr:hypothetical protein [Nanoarchaeota archaeon]MBU1051386.1 hypothetical protein [Nanoarchaeota archaeon]MBU1987874.1 hypothetical protein [Nanoarchaeota archaeon]
MKTIRNGLLTALATVGVFLAPGLIGGALRNYDNFDSAQIVGREGIESNTPYTLARDVKDTDNDGHPDTTWGYSVCIRSPVISAGTPSDDEVVEFYRQKAIWEDR